MFLVLKGDGVNNDKIANSAIPRFKPEPFIFEDVGLGIDTFNKRSVSPLKVSSISLRLLIQVDRHENVINPFIFAGR